MASSNPFSFALKAEQLFKDSWTSSPPQVTSYLSLTYHKIEDRTVTYTSPNCGLGWNFHIKEIPESRIEILESKTNTHLVRRADVILQPGMCSSMPLSTVRVDVKVSFPSGTAQPIQEAEFIDVSLKSNLPIGSYRLPLQYEGQVHIEITLTFSDSDGLSFPTTSSPSAVAALQQSLDASSFVDSKFYLFSARVRDRATRPRAVFAKSILLSDRSSYFRDLFSSETGDKNGTLCDLREDVPEEVGKLDANAFGYEDDSDLEEDIEELEEVTGKMGTSNLRNQSPMEDGTQRRRQCKSLDHFQDGRAFAINGIAYKTWKAFIYYTYTNEIQFNELKSQQNQVSVRPCSVDESNNISCSPKSMYRFAKSANIPCLESIAKSGISRGLTQENIIHELFSAFTSRYQEIIELEVDFLLKNFIAGVADRFDDMLQTVVLGGAQHCFRVLAFTLRRLRGARAEAAWLALSRHVPHLTQERQAEVEVRKLEEGGVEEVEAMVKEANVATAALNEPSVKGKKRGKKTKGVALNLWDDKEVKERMEHEVRESTTQEKAEQKAKEREATEQKAIGEAKVKAEQEEMELFERKVRAQQDAREEAEQEAQKRVEEELKAEEERLAREKSEQEARAKEEAERENEERARKENEEMEREKGQDKTPTAAGEESGRNSISNFGGTGWGSSGGPSGGWGLGSWGEKAKSKAPSIKSAFGSAWGSSTFGSLGFGDAGRDSQLSPEEPKLIDISGEPAKNSSSLFDDWDHAAATPSNLANDTLDTPATEHAGDASTTHDPPPVLNDRAPSEDQYRVPSPSLVTVPTESTKVSTAGKKKKKRR